MGKIQILDDHLANQIAAGEVVERPSSIVKELVENAIDAEATRIQIEIEEGGISYIRVSDNGTGMEREDAKLAFSRHATSKIKRERDLFSIRTLGFRGEALPSIASVAKVTLTTAYDPSQLAVMVQVEGGEFQAIEDTSRSQGTDVIVRELFYNTPARLKYLKSVNTEVSHVADVVGRLALAHPHIAFSLIHQGRELFRSSGDGKLIHVLHALYGKQVAGQMVSFEAEDPDFRVSGFVTKPEITRASRSYLTLILNGRFVRSIPITQSILKAYGTLLPSGRYPLGVIHVQMDPKIVDVNVHPSKLEVRLSKEKECCQLIEQAIKQSFQNQHFVPQVMRTPGQAKLQTTKVIQEGLRWDLPVSNRSGTNYSSTPVQTESQVKEEKWTLQTAPQLAYLSDEKNQSINQLKPKEQATKSEKRSDWMKSEVKQTLAEDMQSPSIEDVQPTSTYKSKTYTSAFSQLQQIESVDPESDQIEESPLQLEVEMEALIPEEKLRLPEMMPLTQVHGTYIVAQSADGFYLLDQHAAHERIYYEIFSKKMGEENHRQQPLLIPLTIDCSPSEAKIVEGYIDYLQQWGLEMEPFGGSTFLVRSYPNWFPKEDAENLIHEMIEWLKEHGRVDTAQLRDAGAKMMSCKAAIKANRHLRRDEMEELLKQLNRCENPFTCPHGRPIFVHFSTYELEKMFKRVM